MVMFTFFALEQKNVFGANLVQNIKVVSLSKANLNMQNSMMMFAFCIFDHKYHSWANLVQKFKNVSSK